MVMSIVRYETSSGYLKLIRYTSNPNSHKDYTTTKHIF